MKSSFPTEMGLHVMSPLVDLLICGRRWLFIGVLFAGPPLQIVSASATAQEAVLSNGSEDGSRIMVLVCAILAVGLTLLGALLLWLSGNRAGSTRQAGPPQGVGVGSPALAPVPVPESAPKAVVEPLPDADPTEAVLKRMMKASGHAAQPGAQAADENIPKNRWRATVARVGPAYISVRSTFDNVDGLYQRMPQLVNGRPAYLDEDKEDNTAIWFSNGAWVVTTPDQIGASRYGVFVKSEPVEPGSAADSSPHAAVWLNQVKEVTLFSKSKWEAEMARLPERIVVRSKFSNVDGGFKIVRDVIPNMHPSYYDPEDETAIWWVNGKWVLTEGRDSIGAAKWTQVGSSKAHAGLSPCEATWGDLIEYVRPHHDTISANAHLFEDEEFLAEESSLGPALAAEHPGSTWLRVTEMTDKPAEEMALFHNIEPTDIVQGSLGDCWLLAAIAALAEFPGYIEDQLFLTKTISPAGKYTLRLWDIHTQSWKQITIDDKIPCEEKLWFAPARPIVAKTLDSEAWVLLLEKAFAKLAGNYSNLNGGQCMVAWVALTGCEEQQSYKRLQNGTWGKSLLDMESKREAGLIHTKTFTMKTDKALDNETMFSFLQKCDDRNFLMAASIYDGRCEGARPDGLVTGHAYSLITAKESCGFKLVQLRNPWGDSKEWNGGWSDKSEKWKEHPDVKAELEFSEAADGLFWMEWGDFASIYDTVEVCAKNMRLSNGQEVKRASLKEAKQSKHRFTLNTMGCHECTCGYTCGTVTAKDKHLERMGVPKHKTYEAADVRSAPLSASTSQDRVQTTPRKQMKDSACQATPEPSPSVPETQFWRVVALVHMALLGLSCAVIWQMYQSAGHTLSATNSVNC